MEIRRIQAGANAWRKVEGVMGDKHISWKLKGKVLSSRVTTTYLSTQLCCGGVYLHEIIVIKSLNVCIR